MTFEDAVDVTGTATSGLARRRLERALDAADEAHRETVSARLAMSRYCAELDADLAELQALAEVMSRAGRLAALRLNRLCENNLSVEDAGPVLGSHITERFVEVLDGLPTSSAVRVVAAAAALDHANPA